MLIPRRSRAVLSTAGLWSAAFALGGVFLSGWAYVRVLLEYGEPWPLSVAITVLARNALTFAIAGGAMGAGFALLLTMTERNRTFRELGLGRVAAWGTASGLALASVLALGDPAQNPLLFFVVTGLMGGVSATGMVALARRGLPTYDRTRLVPPEEGRISLPDGSEPA